MTAKQLLELIAKDCAKNGGLILTHKGKQYLIEEAWVKDWDNRTREKTMKQRPIKAFTTAIILTAMMLVSFVFLFILNEYKNQPTKAQCSSYINTNCEGYHTPMCERE